MTTSADLRVQPGWHFILSHPAYFMSFGFGCGLFPRAPGTVGTLLALPMYWYISPRVTDELFLMLLIVAFTFGVWACEKTGKALGVADYSGMVFDLPGQ